MSSLNGQSLCLQKHTRRFFCCVLFSAALTVSGVEHMLSHHAAPELMTQTCYERGCTCCTLHFNFSCCLWELTFNVPQWQLPAKHAWTSRRSVSPVTIATATMKTVPPKVIILKKSNRTASGEQRELDSIFYIDFSFHRELEPQSPSWPGSWSAAPRSTCLTLKRSTRSCSDSPSTLSWRSECVIFRFSLNWAAHLGIFQLICTAHWRVGTLDCSHQQNLLALLKKPTWASFKYWRQLCVPFSSLSTGVVGGVRQLRWCSQESLWTRWLKSCDGGQRFVFGDTKKNHNLGFSKILIQC